MAKMAPFLVEVDARVIRRATAACELHGIEIKDVVEKITTDVLTQYAEVARNSVQLPTVYGVNPEAFKKDDEDDIPF